MRFGFENLTPKSADLVLRWEKLSVAVPIQVEVNTRVLAEARRAMAELAKDDWRTPYRAASFTFNDEGAMGKGAAAKASEDEGDTVPTERPLSGWTAAK